MKTIKYCLFSAISETREKYAQIRNINRFCKINLVIFIKFIWFQISKTN
jgi:hypothetical protein